MFLCFFLLCLCRLVLLVNWCSQKLHLKVFHSCLVWKCLWMSEMFEEYSHFLHRMTGVCVTDLLCRLKLPSFHVLYVQCTHLRLFLFGMDIFMLSRFVKDSFVVCRFIFIEDIFVFVFLMFILIKSWSYNKIVCVIYTVSSKIWCENFCWTDKTYSLLSKFALNFFENGLCV